MGTGLAGAGLAAAGLGASQNAQAGNAPEIKMQDARHGTVAYQGKNIPITLNDTTRAMGTLAKAKLNGQTVDIRIGLDGARAWIPPSAMPHMGESMMAGGTEAYTMEDEQLDGMALGELQAIVQAAKKIFASVKQGVPLEAWMYKKITNGNEGLTAVAQQINNPAVREQQGVAEGFPDDILAMAKKVSPNARIRGSRDEEIARRDAMLAQRAQDHANAPEPKGVSDDERASLEAELQQLMPKYDRHYQMIDNYTQHMQAKHIADRVHEIQRKLKPGVAEGWDPEDDEQWSAEDPKDEMFGAGDAYKRGIQDYRKFMQTKVKPSNPYSYTKQARQADNWEKGFEDGRYKQGMSEIKDPNDSRWSQKYNKDLPESTDYASAVNNLLNEFAGGMGVSSVAVGPGAMKNPARVGSLFGGSYNPKSPFKKKTKKESIIKR